MQYFGTDGIRGRVGTAPISVDWILKLGFALGTVLRQSKVDRPKVLIGKDTRISGYVFESALEAGLCAAGVDTILLGPMPTPGVAYLTRTLRVDIGLVISASHNLYEDNGIKFFCSEGMKISSDMEARIEAQLLKPMQMVDSRSLGKASRLPDAEGRYIEFCKRIVSPSFDLRGFKIVIDCAQGATYRVAPRIFSELGAALICVGVEPDGVNINQGCGSTQPAMLATKVLATRADVGIAFDGDGDRVILVDNEGTVLDGDQILYLIARWYQQKDQLKGPVVGTIMSNFGLAKALEALDIPFERVMVGDRYILQGLQEHGGHLGGEPSGHILCLDSSSTGDGIIAALKVLELLRESEQTLAMLLSDYVQYPQVLINVPLKKPLSAPNASQQPSSILDEPQFQAVLLQAQEALKGQGRVLVRPSGTEPLLRIMVEGRDPALVASLAKKLDQSISSILEAIS